MRTSTKAKSNTKKVIVLELLRRKEGATITELAKATHWQNHSIRGFKYGTARSRAASEGPAAPCAQKRMFLSSTSLLQGFVSRSMDNF